jgi:outer membrane protein OmpA-like peptidoglycan-associated protein
MLAMACGTGKNLAKRKKYMDNTYTDFKKTLNDADVVLLTDTVKIIFKNPIIFEFNKATILPEMMPSFERMAKVLLQHSKTEILVVGHTDSVGGDNTNNQQLSIRRADSAVNVLAYYKVSHERMDTWGLGSKEPVASNATEEGRARNRRVEFIVLYNYDKSKKPQ